MLQDPDKITYFAKTNSRGKETPFGIKRKDRARHMYVIGKTGMGKSTLLENMAIQDIRNGEGMAFIDPHGSTADRLLEYVPENRINDVIYFAPFDMEHPVAFNVMEDVGYDKRHLVVSGLLSAFRKIWVDAWSARMEYILSNTLLALLEYEGSTLLDVNRMLVNKAFRRKVVDNVTDPIVKSFWVDEFANYTDRYTQDATPAIQNKVGQFTSNPLIRNIVGQPKSSFDIRRAMDEKKIIIMNLSKGRVGEVNATLLGSMLVTKIYLSAMSRADVPADVLTTLPHFYFYVDEFQNFANQSFADILSEARKYKLNLIIAHQYVEQMEEEVRNAVFGNVGTTVAFRVGPFDAEVLETIFAPQFSATDLVNLGFAQVYLTLMIDGVGSPPFSATTLSPFDPPPVRYIEKVIAASRRQYGKPRIDVEESIKKWSETEAPPEAPKPRRENSQRQNGNGELRRERAPQDAHQLPVPEKAGEPVKMPPPHGLGLDPERKRGEAQGLRDALGHERGLKMTEAYSEAQQQPRREPYTPREQGRRQPLHLRQPHESKSHPPLEGATTLREALLALSKQQENPELPKREKQPEKLTATEPAPSSPQPLPDLKLALSKIINTPPPEPKQSNPEQPRGERRREPVGLPEERLRDMLAVRERPE